MMRMKSYLILTLLCLGLRIPGSIAQEHQEISAQKIAISYFEALTSGDIKKADELATVPYSFDGRETLTKKQQVEQKHREILEDKGRRNIPDYTVTVPEHPEPLAPKVFPKYEIYRINIHGVNVHLDIYVKAGRKPKVIGFRD
jgi:hypothetical protein